VKTADQSVTGNLRRRDTDSSEDYDEDEDSYLENQEEYSYNNKTKPEKKE
jgi:hypothetical protein